MGLTIVSASTFTDRRRPSCGVQIERAGRGDDCHRALLSVRIRARRAAAPMGSPLRSPRSRTCTCPAGPASRDPSHPAAPPPMFCSDQPHGAADASRSRSCPGRDNSRPRSCRARGDRSVDDDPRRGGIGRRLNALKIERGIAPRFDGGDQHRKRLRTAARHDGIHCESLRRSRHRSRVRRSRRRGQARAHVRRAVRSTRSRVGGDERQTVAPAAITAVARRTLPVSSGASISPVALPSRRDFATASTSGAPYAGRARSRRRTLRDARALRHACVCRTDAV